MTLHTSLAAMALLAIPVAALAFGSGSQGQATGAYTTMQKSPVPKFKKADSNHDGMVEWKEAKTLNVPKKMFKRDDLNEDGTLDKTEWMFVRMDLNEVKKPSKG